MTRDLVTEGDAIEGAKVSGSCRNDVKNLGFRLLRPGVRCYLYHVSFDVVATVVKPLAAEAVPLVAEAVQDTEAEIKCEKASILSLEKTCRPWVAPRTGTHKAQHWEFSKQTSVKIDRGHESIKNGIAKAAIANAVELASGPDNAVSLVQR